MTDVMALKLIVEDDSGKRTAVSAKPDAQGILTIGRADDNGLRLDERNVSRHHAKLVQVGPALWRVEDLAAYNGVLVNGVRVAKSQDVVIGDVIRVGDFSLELRHPGELGPEITRPTLLIGNDEGTEPEGSERALARQIAEEVTTPGDAAPQGPQPPVSASRAPAVPGPSPGVKSVDTPQALPPEATDVIPRDEGTSRPADLTPPYAKFLCLVGDQAGVAYDIVRAVMVIGRTKENDIAIDHRSMSRHHAKVTVVDGRYRIADLDSANGLLINDETYSDTDLKHGDVAELGHVRLRFVAPNEPAIMTADERAQVAGPSAARRPKRSLVMPGVALAAVACAIGTSYVYLARPPRAQEASAHAGAQSAADGDEAEQLLGQARQAAALRQFPRAEALASAALALNPSREEARALIVQCDAEQKGHAALEAGISAAGREDWASAFSALKDVPHSSSSAPRATSLLEQVRPNLVQVHVEAARRAVAADHMDEALGQLGAVVALDPNSTSLPELHQAIDDGQKRRLGAHAASDAGDHGGHTSGSSHKESGRSSHSGSSDEPHQLYAEGTRALSDGKYPRALEVLGRCIAQDKNFSRCYRALGIAYAKTGNGPKAAKNYRLYLKADPQAKDASTVRQLLQQYEASQEHANDHDHPGEAANP